MNEKIKNILKWYDMMSISILNVLSVSKFFQKLSLAVST